MTSPDIGHLLNKAARQLRLGFAARLTETGLRPQQAAALMAIAHSTEGQLTPGQLADAIDMDAPTMSGLLDRLSRDGWVTSTSNPEDRRSRLVGLTSKATEAIPAVLRAARAVSDDAVAGLTPDEADLLVSLLSRVCGQGTTELEGGGR